MDKMMCPICGKEFDVADIDYLDNGNPACHNCVVEEYERKRRKIIRGDIENYRTLARRATSSSNVADALQYYKKIVELNSNDWEAAFYVEIYSSLINDEYSINESSV